MSKQDYNTINPAWNGRRPVIVGFLCNWCSYRAADLAGMNRLNIPTTLRDVRIMCTGRLDPAFVMAALRQGADGVLVMGCHPGQCHYESGNMKAMRRMALLRRTLAQLGVHPDRVQLGWASAAQGNIFADKVAKMTEAIARLGPLEWRDQVDDAELRAPVAHELEEASHA